MTDVPINEYYEYYGPTYRLDVPPSNMDDLNTRDYLEKIKEQVFENLRNTAFTAPSVQQQRAWTCSSALCKLMDKPPTHSDTEVT